MRLLWSTITHWGHVMRDIDGLAQDCSNSIANALELLLSCAKPSICDSNKVSHYHDDVIEWKHFPRYWPFVRGIHRWPVNSPHKGQWRGALMFSLICAWINGWVNNGEAGDLKRHRAHHDVTVMIGPDESLAPNNNLNQCWLNVDSTLRNKLSNSKYKDFQGNIFENVVC